MKYLPSANEQGIFVGIANLVDDIELAKTAISLKQLRYIVIETLKLSPFMPIIE